jgi:TolB protein
MLANCLKMMGHSERFWFSRRIKALASALLTVGFVIAAIAVFTVRSDTPRFEVHAAAEPTAGPTGTGLFGASDGATQPAPGPGLAPSTTTAPVAIPTTTTTVARPATTSTTSAPRPSTTTTRAPVPSTTSTTAAPAAPSILGRIVFSSDRKPYGGSQDFDIWVMDADGSNATDLTNSFGMDTNPDLSPDGRYIVWTHFLDSGNRTPLMIMRSDGSDAREVVAATAGLFPPRWSPDGERILYGAQDGVHTIRPDGTDDQLLPGSGISGYVDASWSPDGNRLVLGAYAGASSDDGVWVIDLRTQAKTHIVSQVAEGPVWSPTGDLIAFAGGPDRTLFTVRPDGRDLTALTTFGPSADNSTWNSNLAWSPDGSRLLFTHGQATERIWEINRDGSAARVVVDVNARDRQGTF